jgi:Protein of unknown function (DUF2934)
MSLTQARQELERKLAQTNRLVSLVSDPTTSRSLMELREELAEAIRTFPSRRETISEDEVRARAHDIWEQHGCPHGRDQEFWVRAERELVETAQDHS